MKSRRFVFFFLAILVGAAAGLAFGWLLMPPKAPSDAAVTSLRADFKTDLVLMTAESFRATGDGVAALQALAQVEEGDPLTLLGNSIQYARAAGYSEADLELMSTLLNSIDAEIYLEWNRSRGQ